MLKHKYNRCRSLLVAMEDRIRYNERKQQLIIAFFAKVVLTNPELLLNRARNRERLGGAAKRRRLMAASEEQQQQHVDAPTMENGIVEAAASTTTTMEADVSQGSGLSDGGAVKQEPTVPECYDVQSFDNICDDVWEELGAIPGTEMEQEHIISTTNFDVDEFSVSTCGWVDNECPYLVDSMPFVEY
jgi:hypothetical protein